MEEALKSTERSLLITSRSGKKKKKKKGRRPTADATAAANLAAMVATSNGEIARIAVEDALGNNDDHQAPDTLRRLKDGAPSFRVGPEDDERAGDPRLI